MGDVLNRQRRPAGLLLKGSAGLLAGVLLLSGFAAAAAPAEGYCYDSYDQSVPAPAGYADDRTLYGNQTSSGSFGMAQDMAEYGGRLYVLNSKQGIITVLDEDLQEQGTVTLRQNGEELSIAGASGMYLTTYEEAMELYIADTENKRILRADGDGNVLAVYEKPQDGLYPQESEFAPIKVMAGPDGLVYAICQGIYKGAATFSREGDFLGFYGSNDIDVTVTMLIEYFWKSLMTPEQRGRIQRSVPIEYSNFDIDSKGFIVTCTKVTENSTGELKRLNAKGINVLPVENYGDLEDAWIKNDHQDTSFVDVLIKDDTIIAALDAQRGRVFLYNTDGTLLLIFGGIGRFEGTFRTPSALECIGNRFYVLDPYKDCITRFSPTAYGQAILDANALYQAGRYEETVELWNQVMRQNGNYNTAYIGIARALMGTEQYKEAMTYFKKGQDREGYAQAYEEYRKAGIQHVVVPAMIGIVVLTLLIAVYQIFFKAPKREYALQTASLLGRYRYTMLHPTEGFSAVLRVASGRVTGLSVVLVLLLFMTSIVVRQGTAFLFNPNQVEKLDIRLLFAATVVVFIAFVISNRLVCTLFNGNGTVHEILCVSSLSLTPLLAALLIRTALSHVLAVSESGVMTVLVVLGAAWSGILLLSGMCVIHEYDGKQALLSVIFTVIGMLLMAFIGLLVWGLYGQIASFFSTLVDEIRYMLLT